MATSPTQGSTATPMAGNTPSTTSLAKAAATPSAGQRQTLEQYAAELLSQVNTENTAEQTESGIPTIRKDGHSSSHRKRSRVQEDVGPVFVKEGLSEKESQVKKNKFDEYLQRLYGQIEMVFAKGERGKTMINKLQVYETIRFMGLEIFQMVMALLTLQDDKAALQHQVIQLMAQSNTTTFPALGGTGTTATTTYLQAAMSKSVANNIESGKRLPIPEIPSSLQHAPSEKVLIFKAANKGVQLTKEEKEEFREDINKVIGKELMDEIDIIRPTRTGGHTIIFNNEQSRSKALEALRTNEQRSNIEEQRSCIVAPKKKFAKVVCRDPPDDVTMDMILNEFYSKNNMHLNQVPRMHRETRIIDTRFGWVFEMSSVEAAAVQAQGGRIRYGHARELRVEEYIPLQQCYRCCVFGHNAKECYSDKEYCRLCGKMDHMGWDCPDKNNKERWKCANCMFNNATKGSKLSVQHAAAQLHKCPCAQHQKEIRKAQLAAAGIFTSPIIESSLNLNSVPINTEQLWTRSGAQIHTRETAQFGKNRQYRSKSKTNRRPLSNNNNNRNNSASTSASSVFYGNTIQKDNIITLPGTQNETGSQPNDMHRQPRPVRIPRPKSYDGWKVAGSQRQPVQMTEQRGRNSDSIMGTNSLSNLPMPTLDISRPISPSEHDNDE